MCPLLGGAVTQYLSWRWVFYLNVPICLTTLIVVGMLALSRLDLGDSYGFQATALALIGISLGLISSVTVLAAQNAAEPRDIGVATSTTTLSRTIGATIGVTVFGAIFTISLQWTVPADLAA